MHADGVAVGEQYFEVGGAKLRHHLTADAAGGAFGGDFAAVAANYCYRSKIALALKHGGGKRNALGAKRRTV